MLTEENRTKLLAKLKGRQTEIARSTGYSLTTVGRVLKGEFENLVIEEAAVLLGEEIDQQSERLNERASKLK